jgi:hypothetical protein
MSDPDARCKDCGYTLKGLPSGACPECGRPFDWNKRTTFRLGDEPGALGAVWLVRKRALIRFLLVFIPGFVVVLSALLDGISLNDWGCFLILIYPFWVVACTVCALALASPMGMLGVLGSMLLGGVIAFFFYALFGPWVMALAVPTGLVAGLVFKHMQYSDLI